MNGKHVMRKVRELPRKALYSVLALVAGGGLALGLVVSGTSQAATEQCAAAVTAPGQNSAGQYCSSQEIVSLGLMLAAPNKAAAYSQLEVKAASDTNATEDFSAYQPGTPVPDGQTKVFEYSPRGVLSGLCAAVSNSGKRLVLKPCNQRASEQFTPGSQGTNDAVAWDDAAGNAITTFGNAAYGKLYLSPDSGAAGQMFTWTNSVITAS